MKSEVLDIEINCKIIHIGLSKERETGWLHDKWVVGINRIYFDYRSGMGLRHYPRKRDVFKNFTLVGYEQFSQPKPPKLDDVLYALLADSKVLGLTFENWCDDFGYDPDSRKAEKIYNACKENAEKLKTALNIQDLTPLQEKFRDY